MGTEAKLLRLPARRDKATCHLTIPRFDSVIRRGGNAPSGLSALATEMERVAEQFDQLAHIFDECSDATYSPEVFFIDGRLTFVFQIPHRFVQQLRELGWRPEDLDVDHGPDGRVPDESDISDA